jgi:putative ABC transport system permease protein
MLRLSNITKTYQSGETTVHALKGISLSFRKNEFVSILGPSGCGKTTTLNIIGGLDKYTTGDLFISGKSTKDFKDRDWDVYRNHRIGFIFQSYNLIPHQTVLGNVELALTISGVSKKERIEKAKKALDKVGLGDKYNKMPNQLSGGQCQRVAIARALVNEPEILLADEPTGALDTETSIQIMELIKEISKEKLVIMVTHNPDLAYKYSTRIISLLDGEVESDTNPFSEEDEIKECEELKNQELPNEEKVLSNEKTESKEKAKMSLWTAIKLSAKNLFTKRKRTALVSLAGSIGIVGVSMVLAVSSGVQGYITSMQDDMLSGYPITVSESSYDLTSMMNSSSSREAITKLEVQDGKVNVNKMVEYLLEMSKSQQNLMVSNEIDENYIKFIKDMPSNYYAAINYEYGIDPTNNIYTTFNAKKNGESKIQSLSSILENYKAVLDATDDYQSLSTYIDMFANSIAQAPSNTDYILSQYDVLEGKVATKADEVMLVVSKKTELADVLFGEMGYYAQDEFLSLCYKAADETEQNKNNNYDENLLKYRFTYDEIMGKSFYYLPNDCIYKKNDTSLLDFNYTYSLSEEEVNTQGVELKVVGILRPKDSISYGCLSSGFYYTTEFTNMYLRDNNESELAKYINDKEGQSIQSGTTTVSGFTYEFGAGYTLDYEYDKYDANGNKTTGTGSKRCFIGDSSQSTALMSIIGSYMGGGSSSSSSATSNIKTLSARSVGGNNVPNQINIYPLNFDSKYLVTDYLDKWNAHEDITLKDGSVISYSNYSSSKDGTPIVRSEIKYTDTIGVIITLINTLINVVSISLICFTALSLVVSTVMIGIITYVSVVERIKEIGVIRALGGRKRDVSNLFIAETVIIGLVSGIFGIGITYIASAIVNVCLYGMAGFNVCALPASQAFIMIGVSVLLTLISGLFPARSAARKDPVVALRTE